MQALSLIETPNTKPRRRKPAPPAKASRPNMGRSTKDPGVMRQIAAATNSPRSLTVGAIIGGFVPYASFHVAHYEAGARPWLWLLVVAALLFSGLSVFEWTRRAFGSIPKALGFVALTEGIMLCTGTPALAATALILLMGINAAATGARLATERN